MKLDDLTIGTRGEAYVAGRFLLDGRSEHAWLGRWSADILRVRPKPNFFQFLTERTIEKTETGFYKRSPSIGAQLLFPLVGIDRINAMMSDKHEVRLSCRGDGLGDFMNINSRDAADMGTSLPQSVETMDFRAAFEPEGLRVRFAGTFGEPRGTDKLKSPMRPCPKNYEIEALMPWALVLVRNFVHHYRVRGYLKEIESGIWTPVG